MTPEHTQAIEQIKQALGPEGWSNDADALAPFLVDQRERYLSTTALLVKPANTAEVSEIMKIAHGAAIAVVPMGGNTGLVGGAVASGEIIMSLERMTKIKTVDAANLTVRVDAGVILADVQAAASEAGAYFPLSLGAEGSCRIGGNLSTNAGGVHVVRYGNARDLVLGLEVVLADGRIWDGMRSLRKDNTGYDLKQLFIGAEGTLGIITGAVLRLFPAPKSIATALVGCESYDAALALFLHARERMGERLSVSEVMDRFAMEITTRHIPGCRDPLSSPHAVYVLLEADSTDANADVGGDLQATLGEALESGIAQDAVIAQNEGQRLDLWKLREAIPEAQKKEGGSIKHDVSVPVSRVPEFLSRALELVRLELPGVRPVPFGHLGDGNLHFNLTQPEGAERDDFLQNWGRINRLVHDLVVEMGGSFSAEHGIGLLKTADMDRYKSSVEIDLMAALKSALDPKAILNPGKVLAKPEDEPGGVGKKG